MAISTAIVAISSPLLGAMADRASLRKRLLIIYCYIGVICTIGLRWVGPGEVMFGSLLFIIANFGFAGGNVFYNAFIVDVSRRESFGRVSGIAWASGYIGGGLCLILTLFMLRYPQKIGFPEGTFDVGDCMLVAGLWWGIFALPTMFWLRERRIPERSGSLSGLTREGFRSVVRTFREVKRYRQLFRFLVAYLIFNDGIETVIIMASIFGAQVVGMSPDELVLYFIMVQGAAFVGSMLFGRLADWIGNRATLLFTITVWLAIVIWAYRLGWLVGLREDYYILGAVAGLVLGGSQSVARSMQASFTPRDRSAEFFGFYALSGRAASVIGPLIYGTAIYITGSVQRGILSLAVFFIIGGWLLLKVNEAAGIDAVETEQGTPPDPATQTPLN